MELGGRKLGVLPLRKLGISPLRKSGNEENGERRADDGGWMTESGCRMQEVRVSKKV